MQLFKKVGNESKEVNCIDKKRQITINHWFNSSYFFD